MKRTFYELRRLILIELSRGPKTINQLAKNTEINWRSVRQHLKFLDSTRDVTELVSSQYVRIFSLTEQGTRNASMLESDLPKKNHSVDVKIIEDKVHIK